MSSVYVCAGSRSPFSSILTASIAEGHASPPENRQPTVEHLQREIDELPQEISALKRSAFDGTIVASASPYEAENPRAHSRLMICPSRSTGYPANMLPGELSTTTGLRVFRTLVGPVVSRLAQTRVHPEPLYPIGSLIRDLVNDVPRQQLFSNSSQSKVLSCPI
jgi:hypothetical protein